MKKNRFKHQNEEEIEAYIKKNGIDAVKTETGLYYSITKQGNGNQPKPDSNITIAHFAYLCNGDSFDQNEALEINLSETIAGWTEGLQHFNEGSEGILLIPSRLAYGNTDYGSIPAGSVLIFDIQLIQVH